MLSLTARIRTRDGTECVVEIDTKANDALFWSLDAGDRFLVPFYSATQDFQYASDVRRQIIVIPILHKRLCKPASLIYDPSDPPPFDEAPSLPGRLSGPGPG